MQPPRRSPMDFFRPAGGAAGGRLPFKFVATNIPDRERELKSSTLGG
jgi:hypothetical protein